MKKFICAIICVLFVVNLCACSEEQVPPVEPVVVDYTPYLCPWDFDVVEQAKKDGKIHYYFMAGEGFYISETSSIVDKWGDSCLVVFPNGKLMLIDGGPKNYSQILLRNLQRMGVSKLDYILITHPHKDHQNGIFHADNLADGLLAHIEVGMVYYRGGYDPEREDSRLVETVCTELQIPHEILERGDTLEIGEVKMDVLWPLEGVGTGKLTGGVEVNNYSIVVRFSYKEHSSIFAGDLYAVGELFLIYNTDRALVDADMLKIPHHGYDTSSSREFLLAVSPELAIGTGRYPIVESVRDLYKDNGITLLYDLIHGYIHVSSDGTDMFYETSRHNSPNDELNTFRDEIDQVDE